VNLLCQSPFTRDHLEQGLLWCSKNVGAFPQFILLPDEKNRVTHFKTTLHKAIFLQNARFGWYETGKKTFPMIFWLLDLVWNQGVELCSEILSELFVVDKYMMAEIFLLILPLLRVSPSVTIRVTKSFRKNDGIVETTLLNAMYDTFFYSPGVIDKGNTLQCLKIIRMLHISAADDWEKQVTQKDTCDCQSSFLYRLFRDNWLGVLPPKWFDSWRYIMDLLFDDDGAGPLLLKCPAVHPALESYPDNPSSQTCRAMTRRMLHLTFKIHKLPTEKNERETNYLYFDSLYQSLRVKWARKANELMSILYQQFCIVYESEQLAQSIVELCVLYSVRV
jgi:hypothetical protein